MHTRGKSTNELYRGIISVCIVICLLCSPLLIKAQETGAKNDTVAPVMDVGDFARKVFNKKEDTSRTKKSTTILPSIGYNPSFGFVIGAKISAIKQYGAPGNTNLSSFGLEGIYSTKGIITGQARHNIFTEANKWNLQGNWQLSKFVIEDYGIGTGHKERYRYKSDSTFLIRFRFIRLTEKIYRKIGPRTFAGGGVSFDIRSNINDQQLEVVPSTPHQRYSVRNDFDPKKYSANGFIFAFQYNTREHPLRSYGGEYLDFNLRFNRKFIGSTQNSIQLFYDLRKYISLSKANPEHVVALWHWASYTLSGAVPYLELPATAYDTYARSGRAYTMGRFKGPSYACFEAEYRYPITKNKLVSGVAFMNLQTASDDLRKPIFKYWEPGGGGGLRILLQKQSRSTICIDYAFGKYGSKGFFFGLNEVF